MRTTIRFAVGIILLVAMALGGAAQAFAVTDLPYVGRTIADPKPKSLDVAGDLLVAGFNPDYDEEGFRGCVLYDITTPEEASIISTITVDSPVWDVLTDGDVLYVAASDGLRAYDISTPASPSLLDVDATVTPFTLSIDGDTLYVGRWNDPAVISVDVSDPSDLTPLDTMLVTWGNVNSIDIKGNLLACGARNSGGFTLIDVTDPSAMVIEDYVRGSVMEVRFEGGVVIGALDNQFVTWDISDPSDITTASARPFAGAWCMDVDASIAYVGHHAGIIEAYDVSLPGSPVRLPDYLHPGRPYEIVIQGDYLYAAAEEGGVIAIALVDAADALAFEQLAGSDRYTTAIDASENAFPGGASTVILATGANWPDALGGSALAGAVGGPILLTPTAAPRGDVLDEIERLGASRVIILGGEAAVSAAVEAALELEPGIDTVDRIAGSNRYETAELIAEALNDEGFNSDTAFFATGTDYPDAAAVAPIAAANRAPILLVPDEGLLASTELMMADLHIEYGVILGGESAVTLAVELDLFDTLEDYVRIEGPDRYGTAAAIADFGVTELDMSWNWLGVATGQSFPDALTGGVVQGQTRSVMLLTRSASLPGATATQLGSVADEIGAVRFYGGTAAIEQPVRDQILGIVQ